MADTKRASMTDCRPSRVAVDQVMGCEPDTATSNASSLLCSGLDTRLALVSQTEEMASLEGMPVEMKLEILSQMGLVELLHVHTAGGGLKRVLDAHPMIWETARAKLDMPAPPPGMSEACWVKLIFVFDCELCGGEDTGLVYMDVFMRLCSGCYETRFVDVETAEWEYAYTSIYPAFFISAMADSCPIILPDDYRDPSSIGYIHRGLLEKHIDMWKDHIPADATDRSTISVMGPEFAAWMAARSDLFERRSAAKQKRNPEVWYWIFKSEEYVDFAELVKAHFLAVGISEDVVEILDRVLFCQFHDMQYAEDGALVKSRKKLELHVEETQGYTTRERELALSRLSIPHISFTLSPAGELQAAIVAPPNRNW